MESGSQPNSDRPSKRLLSDHVDDGLLWLENWIRSRHATLGAAAAVIAVVSLGWWLMAPSSAVEPIENSIQPVEASVVGAATATTETTAAVLEVSVDSRGRPGRSGHGLIVVHVVGAVAEPGLVEVEEGARVADVVAGAGGIQPDAEVELLNLAEPVSDGMQVRVPRVGERDGSDAADKTRPLIRRPQTPSNPDASVGTGPVDVNTAQAADLERLPGVGPAIAAAIVAWREDNGPFITVDDLERVPGIGPAKLAALRDTATV